jgi:hypothetical protein
MLWIEKEKLLSLKIMQQGSKKGVDHEMIKLYARKIQ